MRKLGSICTLERKAVGKDAQLPYLGLDQIESQTGRILGFEDTELEKRGTSTDFTFDTSHVLYSKLRPYLNKVALPDRAGRCTTELIPLLPNGETDRKFLAYLLRSPKTLSHAVQANNGGRMPRVDLKHLFSLEVAFPPLPEQKRIAAELDRRLALIAEARQAAERRLAAAELLESALFREVYGGVTPVSIGAPMEKGASGPFAQPEPFPHPPQRAWKDPSPYRRLSEVARLESGHTPSRKKPEWWGGDIPWIALPDIRALDGRIAMETVRNTNPEGIANSSARILPKDTVVFGRDVQVGFTTIIGRPMATSQHFFNWICGDDLNPRYLMHALRASKPYLESMSSGAIHKTIYMPAARDFHLLLPPRETQDAIAADLDTRLAEAAAILESARTAHETIKALPAASLREVFG